MKQGFEAIDRKFHEVNKRFAMLLSMWGGGIALLALLMSVYEFVG